MARSAVTVRVPCSGCNQIVEKPRLDYLIEINPPFFTLHYECPHCGPKVRELSEFDLVVLRSAWVPEVVTT